MTTVTAMPRKKPIPQDETSAQKFVRLAKYRMTHLLKVGDQVVALGKYEHTPEQSKRIVDDLFDLARRTQAALDKTKKDSTFEF